MSLDLSNIFIKKFSELGLDISDSAVRAVRIKTLNGKTSIVKKAEVPLLPGVMMHGEIKEHQQLILALKELRVALYLRNPFVVVSVSDQPVFTTVVNTPKLPPEKIQEFLALNAPEELPFPSKDAYMGYEYIGEQITQNTTDILVGAVKKSFIDELFFDLNKAGFNATALEPHGVSLARFIKNDQSSIVVVDIRMEDSLVAISESGHVVFSDTLHLGLSDLYESMHKAGISDEKAKEIMSTSITTIPEASSLVNEFYLKFATEINRVIRFKGGAVEKILFSAELPLPNFAEYLTTQISTKVISFVSELAQKDPSAVLAEKYLRAYGAALRGEIPPDTDRSMTLLPFSVKQFFERHKSKMVVSSLVRISVTALITLSIMFVLTATTLEFIGRGYVQRISQFKRDPNIDKEIAKAKSFNSLVKDAGSVLDREKFWNVAIDKIMATGVSGIRYTSMTITSENNQIIMSGHAEKREDLTALRDALIKTTFFAKPPVIPGEDLQRPVDINFRLTLEVDPSKVMRQP